MKMLLRLLVLLALGAPCYAEDEENRPPTLPEMWSVFEGRPSPPLFIFMHGLQYDYPHLFSRLSAYDVQLDLFEREIYRTQMTREMAEGLAEYNPEIEALDLLFYRLRDDCTKKYRMSPHKALTELDWISIQVYLARKKHTLIRLRYDDPIPAYAYCDWMHGVVALTEMKTSETGLCDRSIAIHEMTHYMQVFCSNGGYTYSNQFNDDSQEFAAYVTENTEKVFQGWTMGDMLKYDSYTIPQAYAEGVIADVHVPIVSRMNGGLEYMYLNKYGPQFCGRMGLDLRILCRWTKSFECMGTVDYRFLPEEKRADWMKIARDQVAKGLMSPLASTCQTFLAINGENSWYPVPSARIQDHPEIPVDYAAARQAIENVAASPELAKAALEFLDRCDVSVDNSIQVDSEVKAE